VNLYIDGFVERMDSEVIQVLERRHSSPRSQGKEQEEVVPTECQTAEGEAYGTSAWERHGDYDG
jgi:hypothetical protein